MGWAVSAVNDRHLTIKALEMALKRRGPAIGLLHHSDQGCTYARILHPIREQRRKLNDRSRGDH
jgi:transposase InsO family protein